VTIRVAIRVAVRVRVVTRVRITVKFKHYLLTLPPTKFPNKKAPPMAKGIPIK
jgi:hypothetical protein